MVTEPATASRDFDFRLARYPPRSCGRESIDGRRCFAMAERKPARKGTQKSATSTTAFTDEERAAMKERARELKAEANKADGESAVLAKIAEMPEPDRAMAERLHEIVKASAPALSPKTWYGMPAYARDGKVVCFFQSAQKFKSRYATLRLQRRGEPRRRRPVAGRLRAEGADRRRRGEDQRAREEGGELRAEVPHAIHEAARQRQASAGDWMARAPSSCCGARGLCLP